MKRYIAIPFLLLVAINGIDNQRITGVSHSQSFAISNPVTGHSGLIQLKLGAVTITEVCASTDTGTMTIQFDERAEATPNTGGTDVMTSALVGDSDEQCTTAFDNAAIAATAVMNLDIDAVASSPTQGRIHVFYSN